MLGLAMAMSSTDHLYLAVAYAFGGLMAGIFARFGRFASRRRVCDRQPDRDHRGGRGDGRGGRHL